MKKLLLALATFAFLFAVQAKADDPAKTDAPKTTKKAKKSKKAKKAKADDKKMEPAPAK